MKKKTLKRIKKNGNEEIRVSWLSYRGTEYVDLRIFSKLTENEILPTQKGFIVPKELVAEIIEGLQQA